jgi:signal transduction histidine kinase
VTDGIEIPTARPERARDVPDSALEAINRLWTIARAFSNTAHDVNNALQVIAGSAELLEARELDPAVRRRIETIRTEAARAATTVNRLLDYVRAQPGRPQRTDLRPLVEDAVALRAASANRNRIVLTFDGNDGAPRWARADPATIAQALLNLLLAAEDAVSRQRNARIAVSVGETTGTIDVRVEASSDGRVSEAFETPDADVQEWTAGMQMWAAASVAAAHQGAVRVERTSRGMVVTMTLPGGS